MRQVEASPNGQYIRYDDLLGRGSYKAVYKAFDSHEAVEVAWNKLQVDKIPEGQLSGVKFEVELLERLDHKNIINLFHSWTGKNVSGRTTLDFITELMTSGTLKEYLTRTRSMKLKVIRRWCHNLLEAITYLHEQTPPVMHRDLKCDNIFINGNVGEVKIGDLGLSGVKHDAVAQSVIGTPEFMAPELYEEAYTEKVDVYAFGMCMLEMITMRYPYSECENPAQIFRKVFAGEQPESFRRLPPSEIKNVIAACLEREAKRPTARQLLEHPFFAGWASDDGVVTNVDLTSAKSLVKQVPKNSLGSAGKIERKYLDDRPRSPKNNALSPKVRGEVKVEKGQCKTLAKNQNDSAEKKKTDYQFTDAKVSVGEGTKKGEVRILMTIPVDGELNKVEFFFNPLEEDVDSISTEVADEFDLTEDEGKIVLRDLRKEYLEFKRKRDTSASVHEKGSLSETGTPKNVAHRDTEKRNSKAKPSPRNLLSADDFSITDDEFCDEGGARKGISMRSRKSSTANSIYMSEDSEAGTSSRHGSACSGFFDAKNFKTNMALLEHCAKGSSGVVQAKLESGADVNYADYDNRTPLHLAATEGHADIVSLLIAYGAEIDAEDRWGSTPLDDASKNQHEHVVELLVSAGAYVESRTISRSEIHSMELMQYAANGFYDMVRQKLMAGAEAAFADYDKRTPLHLSCAEGHEDVSELLLINGADPMFKDRFGATPTDEAVKNGHEDMIALLRRYGGYVPAHLLSKEDAEYQYGMDLVNHAFRGRVDKVKYLLENGANVQFADYDRRTALHLACAEGHKDVAMALLSAGADPEYQDRWGVTSFDEAKQNKHIELLRCMKEFSRGNGTVAKSLANNRMKAYSSSSSDYEDAVDKNCAGNS